MEIRAALYRCYSALEQLIAPGLRYSQVIYEEALGSQVTNGTLWLDLGCGHQILPPWRAEQEARLVARCDAVIGIDVDLPSLRQHRNIRVKTAASASQLPFRDESFSLVTANMVVEHLEAPERQFAEVARVLRPGGIFLMHTPNRRGYPTIAARLIPGALKKRLILLLQGRPGEDVFETFYRANTEEAIERLAANAGLEVEEIRLIASSAQLAVLPPLAVVELVWIRLLMTHVLTRYRPFMIATLRRPARTGERVRASGDAERSARAAAAPAALS